MEDTNSSVYSKNVIEFVTIANEFCVLIENTDQLTRFELVNDAHKLLPFLYLKATILPEVESIYDDYIDKYVSEEIYDQLKSNIEVKLGQYDAYQEVFNEDFNYSDTAVAASISEDLSDIYQDIKNFLMLYRVSTEETMNDALWELQNNFGLYWGQKLTNCLRALHSIRYGDTKWEDEEENNETSDDENTLENYNTNNWILSKKQEDFRNDHIEDIE